MTRAVRVPVPARPAGWKTAIGAPSSGAMVPSVDGLSVHWTWPPCSEGAKSAFRKNGSPAMETRDAADSSIPRSSVTARTMMGTAVLREGSERSRTDSVASPGPTALTVPLSSTVNTDVSDEAHVRSGRTAGAVSYSTV